MTTHVVIIAVKRLRGPTSKEGEVKEREEEGREGRGRERKEKGTGREGGGNGGEWRKREDGPLTAIPGSAPGFNSDILSAKARIGCLRE